MLGKLLKLIVVLVIAFLIAFVIAKANGSQGRMGKAFGSATTQQPLFSDYKGVQIGMAADEVHAKLGQPGQKLDEQEFYIFNERETAQIVYDKANKVNIISVDFIGGVGAPDYRAVVGPEITVRPDGSMYKMVRYEQMGFWVSYSRTAGSVVMVTITIQKIE